MSPRTKEQNEEIRKRRTREIMQAAVQVYAEKGYAASDIGEIAERAGLARGLVYHYFKSKQVLFRELNDRLMEQIRQTASAHFEREGSAYDRFGEYARMVCRQVLEDPASFRFSLRIHQDLHYLYTDPSFSPFGWVKTFLRPMAQAMEKGMDQQTVRRGDANLLAVQFWGALSQGMNYLDQLQQEASSREWNEQEKRRELENVIDKVVESALALIRPA